MIMEKTKLERTGKWGGARVYIPSDVISDSQFPFKIGSEVTVEINPENKTLVISEAKKQVPP